jgi:hypothetical protein
MSGLPTFLFAAEPIQGDCVTWPIIRDPVDY